MKDAPRLDVRDTEAILQALLASLPAYVPGWEPPSSGPGQAILQVYARYLRALAERIERAPAKHRLAFLQMLGLGLMSAQAARAPLVFETFAGGIADGRLPERARAGAQLPDEPEPVVFETERAIALAAAQLREVVSVWPGVDGYADHSADHLAGRPFTLFDALQPLPHALYLAHDQLFALTGQCTVEVRFELALPASEPLPLAWEYWDGAVWRGFKQPFAEEDSPEKQDQSFDGTAGLTRSGVVRLMAECAEAQETRVDNIESYWLRARLDGALSRMPGLVLPEVAHIRVRTLMRKDLWQAGPPNRHVNSPTDPIDPSPSPETVKVFIRVMDCRGAPVRAWLRVDTYGEDPQFLNTNEDGRETYDAKTNCTYKLVSANGLGQEIVTFRVDYYPIDLSLTLLDGAGIDTVIVDGQVLDHTKPFPFFGALSLPGSACCIRSDELLRKPGAQFYSFAWAESVTAREGTDIALEYWSGGRWSRMASLSSFLAEPRAPVVPADVEPTSINGITGLWIRFVLLGGGFLRQSSQGYGGWLGYGPWGTSSTRGEPAPLVARHFRLGYLSSSQESPIHHCLTRNDFQWADRSEQARWTGGSFAPFTFSDDTTPGLYLGFDKRLPADLIGLYFDIVETEGRRAGPPLSWEYWDGHAWRSIGVEDETRSLALPGMVIALWPGVDAPEPLDVLHADGYRVQLLDPRVVPRLRAGDRIYISQQDQGEMATVASVEAGVVVLASALGRSYLQAKVAPAGLARFGRPRTWMRARLQADAEPLICRVNGIHRNAVWAIQAQTFENELLGSGIGRPSQVLFARNSPVLAGEVLEVRELYGARASVELPMLLEDLAREGLSAGDVRTVAERGSGPISEAWVRWQERPHLYFSGPDDRHYTIERSRGRLIFGDGGHGRLLPVSRDNVRLAHYRSGGGSSGNVPAGTITQLLSGGTAQSVTNPRGAEGGADSEPIERVTARGAGILRHCYQAISPEDYEDLARQTSPAVAYARALPTTHPSGRPEPGWVRVIIVPRSRDPRPQPSFELRQEVQVYLAFRAPASMANRVSVTGPDYLPIGVEAVLVPRNFSNGAFVLAAVTEAVQGFLHPLTGGPEGRGWPAGRDVFLSDLAALVLGVSGLDQVTTLRLLAEGTPRGEVVAVPEDRIVVAGPLRIRLHGAEG